MDAWVKHENHNPTGAFKVRGGLNLIARLSPQDRTRGVISATTGNHGRSIAFAAARAGASGATSDERCDLLAVEASELRHLCQKRAAHDWPHAGHTAQQILFCPPDRLCSIV